MKADRAKRTGMGNWTRRLALAAGAAASLALVASCGQQQGGAAAADAPVNIFNWSDYIDPESLEQFTRETGRPINYETFDNNEMVETRLLPGQSGIDLAVPSTYVAHRLIQAGALQPFDRTQLSNIGNLWPELVQRIESIDPGLRHVVPYMWGTVGIGMDRAKVAQRLPGVDLNSWAVVFDPANLARLSDCGVVFLDSPEDMIPLVMFYLGDDPNSTDPAVVDRAVQHLMKLRPHITRIHSSEGINLLAGGTACIAVGYSGDMLQAGLRAAETAAANPAFTTTVEYVLPREGSQLWFDVFVMPKDAPNPEGAHQFVNFMLRPEVIARSSNYVQYANANQASKALLDPAVRDNPNIYPPEDVMARLYVNAPKEAAFLQRLNDAWARVRTGT